MEILRQLGPAKLLASEQGRIRTTADALLFCGDVVTDSSARAAFADFCALGEHLVESGRWTARRAGELADEIWACGPGLDAALRQAA
jgi:hypothetical protein